ncbi:DNA-binding protein [Streptacidiphilus pinicola]|uniref:DNA-binding protein n=1 Tax=Streptacidiphilus pinicola TaxID=2219663 RepID=A0A2X0ITZ1_9ACTN|nr:pyridoxamine 5'-phosphate oxidase family protein [Streptacidiphilus pinicola]RAG86821.1 DNA-binding protein [Streptacidiphilus pinicola]
MFAASSQTQYSPRRGRPGDLGRRITHRRRELGLSVDELAERAGMAPAFVEWAETRPAELGRGGLARIAAALGTSPQELLGGDQGAPPGRSGPDRRVVLTELTDEECRCRLSSRGVGRVVFTVGDELIVRPVNYLVVDGAVLFRTEPDGALAKVVGRRVVLEVDRLDEVLAQGWSLLVSGVAEEDRHDVDRPGTAAEQPHPWASGPRELLVRIHPTRITGRELRPGLRSAPPRGT